jgi:DNA-binding PadR family transcriptional regulator
MEFSGVTPVILGMLRLGPRSGYDIKRFVDKSTRFFWAASYGQIYPELKRLERAGLIEGESDPTGNRRRVVYKLTPAGEAALHEWLVSPSLSYELRDEGFLKLFFADALDRAEALELVRAIRAGYERGRARLSEVEPLARERSGFPYEVLRWGLALNQFHIERCAELERRLEGEEEK